MSINFENRLNLILMNDSIIFSLQTNAKLIEQAKAEKNQQFFASLLHRYLCSSIGKHNAVKLMPRYIRMLSELEEMAQIMISKRLLY